MKKSHARHRWAVQMRTRRDPEWTGALGVGWVFPKVEKPAHVDYWPASWRTRREARIAARQMADHAHGHSPDWEFRPLRIKIVVVEQY